MAVCVHRVAKPATDEGRKLVASGTYIGNRIKFILNDLSLAGHVVELKTWSESTGEFEVYKMEG